MHITMVKKVLADGSPCRKCAEVESRLLGAGLMERINRIVIADENDPESDGMVLARRLEVDTAPFFIVEDDHGIERVYTIYFRFVREVLNATTPESEEIADIMDKNPDLDYI